MSFGPVGVVLVERDRVLRQLVGQEREPQAACSACTQPALLAERYEAILPSGGNRLWTRLYSSAFNSR